MGASTKNSSGRGRRGRMRPNAEINVTPFVDVMLVLLIIFMITAPLLATGVPVDLPKTKAEALPAEADQPLMVTVDREGNIYVGTQEESVELEALAPMLSSIASDNLERRIYVRGDQTVAYGRVVTVLSLIQQAGFRNAGMVVEDPNKPRGGR